MTKRIILVAALVGVLASCGKPTSSSEYQTLKDQYDSLALVSQNYEQELSETDSLVASVLMNFQEISSVESKINVDPNGGEVKRTEQERIKDNMLLINDKLRASSEAIDRLQAKLQGAGRDNKRLQSTIAILRSELEKQKERIQSLSEELERKNISIGILDSMLTRRTSDVDRLSGDVDRLNSTTAKQAEALAAQEKELNTVRYCIGTRSDLKDMGILKGGNISTENANANYFTRADMRELNQIPLFSRKAKLLTVHPSSSYELVAGSDKQLVLYIRNAKAFWSNSKMLVVQVD